MSEFPTPQHPALLETVAHYYGERLRAFGATPQGVDWKSAESQVMRFSRLLQVFDDDDSVSLNDYGCGYGALLDYVRTTGRPCEYRGYDISESMIEAARAGHAGDMHSSFTSDRAELLPAAYTVASGIFNVKLDYAVETWHEYVMQTVTILDTLSTRGFGFNMLSIYSDPEKRRETLFYADPLQMFDACKRRFSPQVSLLHDYPLYEFTIIVRK